MLIVKKGKLFSLDKSDQKKLYEIYSKGGRYLLFSFVNNYLVMKIINSDNQEICSLAGQDVYIIKSLLDSSQNTTPIKLSDFMKAYCPDYNTRYGDHK